MYVKRNKLNVTIQLNNTKTIDYDDVAKENINEHKKY